MHRFMCDDYCEEDSFMGHLFPALAWLVGIILVVLLVAGLTQVYIEERERDRTIAAICGSAGLLYDGDECIRK